MILIEHSAALGSAAENSLKISKKHAERVNDDADSVESADDDVNPHSPCDMTRGCVNVNARIGQIDQVQHLKILRLEETLHFEADVFYSEAMALRKFSNEMS